MTDDADPQMKRETRPDLKRMAARQVAVLMGGVPVGRTIPITQASPLTDTLEFFVPQLLRTRHPEWERESLDGLFFSYALKTESVAATFRGMCILISDQAMTPFELSVRMLGADDFASLRIRVGEPGGGNLGISGPVFSVLSGQTFLGAIEERSAAIDWKYDISL